METNTAGNSGIMIGGTIAVPDDNVMDMSTRSELTIQDFGDSHDPFSNPGPSPGGLLQHRRHRRQLRTKALAERNRKMTALDRNGTADIYSEGSEEETTLDDDDDLVGGDDESDLGLDAMAEQAAVGCFGADADVVLNRPPRRSTLVAENSAIDVSWFASRGLMSRRSFELYQEEMKSKVVQGASNPRVSGKRGMKASRRASISMGDLRNEDWLVKKSDPSNVPAADATSKGNLSHHVSRRMPRRKTNVPKIRPVEEGMAGLVKSGSVEKLVSSIVSAMKHGDAPRVNESASHIGLGPSKNKSLSDLSTAEIKVLTKMMTRLSQEEDASLSQSNARAENASTQNEIVMNRITSRDYAEDELVDYPPREKSLVDLPLDIAEPIEQHDQNDMSFSSRGITGDQLASSMRTSVTRKSGNIADKCAPTRTSNADLTGVKRSEMCDVVFSPSSETVGEDSVQATMFERNSSLGSSLLVMPGEEAGDNGMPVIDASEFTRQSDADGTSTLGKTAFARGVSGMSSITDFNIATRRDIQDESSDVESSDVETTEFKRKSDAIGTSSFGREKLVRVDSASSLQTDCAIETRQNAHAQLDHRGNHSQSTWRQTDSTPTGGEGSTMKKSVSAIFNPMDVNTLEGPALKEDCGDILQEGQEYLCKSMLVNVYSKLRELSMLGHASVKLVDIDVNSHQYILRRKEMRRLGLLESEDAPYLENTKTAGAIVRTVLDEYEMFEASGELCALSSQANRAAMAYDASLLSEFKRWVEESKVKQLDSVTEEVINTLRKECLERQLLLNGRSSENLRSAMEQPDVRGVIQRRRCSLNQTSDQERTLIRAHFGITGGPMSDMNGGVRGNSRRISKGVLTESMIKKTLENSHDCFQEGSSLRNLLEAGLEVVWFSDRHPSDIIYCICVNRDTATVTVVFRGQEGFFNLFKDSAMSRYSNPLAHEDYEGNSEFINLRAAVSDELMRVRRDNKKSTVDEIREKVEKIGRELGNKGGYHLSVTGHNLGGGLATVAGFCLAADPSLELASAVRVFTFASSRVGCRAFQQSFRHLENTGRLLHARFTNSNETVPLLPMQDAYHHVGMQISLQKSNRAGRARTRQCLSVDYNSNTGRFGRLGETVHFMLNCLSAVRSSRISEYQHRMHFAREYRLALGGGVLRFDRKRNHLKSLNDYYLMKCRLSDRTGFTKKQESMPSFILFFFVSCLISFEIALLFKFIATW